MSKIVILLASLVLIVGATTCTHINSKQADGIADRAITQIHLDSGVRSVLVGSDAISQNDIINDAEEILMDATNQIQTLHEKTRTFGLAGLIGGLCTLLYTWVDGIILFFKKKKEKEKD